MYCILVVFLLFVYVSVGCRCMYRLSVYVSVVVTREAKRRRQREGYTSRKAAKGIRRTNSRITEVKVTEVKVIRVNVIEVKVVQVKVNPVKVNQAKVTAVNSKVPELLEKARINLLSFFIPI